MIVEVERFLMIQILEKQVQGESVSSQLICDKARQIFEGIKHKSPQLSGSQFEEP
jgi:uncharacterized protein YoxC